MSCPYVRLADYSTTGVQVYLCYNPLREGEVMAPPLGKLREHCLTEEAYGECSGYRDSRHRTPGAALDNGRAV